MMSSIRTLTAALLLIPFISGASELEGDATPSPAGDVSRPATPTLPADASVEPETRPGPGGSLRAVPLRIPFQGYLRDSGGMPIDTPVSLEVALYNSEFGGFVQWGPETHASVAMDEGIFRISLGETVPLPTSIFDGAPLWLGVSVDGEAEMPRTELQSAPFAMRASVADVAIADDGDWRFLGSGPNVHYPGDAIIGGDAADFDLDSEILIIQAESQDWSVGVLNEPTTADSDFIIGTLNAGNDNKFRIEPGGNVGIGTADPQARLHVQGSFTATGTVDLPDASISADMTADEPGVAFAQDNPALTLTTGMQDVLVVSVNAPGPGYVIVQAQTYSRHSGTTGPNSARFQIDTTAGGAAVAFHSLTVGAENSPSTASTRYPISLSRVFTVSSAGTYTYRLEGEALNGSPATVVCFNGSISALFVPTAYGTVETSQPDPRPVGAEAP